jgi:hypothetical protein
LDTWAAAVKAAPVWTKVRRVISSHDITRHG